MSGSRKVTHTHTHPTPTATSGISVYTWNDSCGLCGIMCMNIAAPVNVNIPSPSAAPGCLINQLNVLRNEHHEPDTGFLRFNPSNQLMIAGPPPICAFFDRAYMSALHSCRSYSSPLLVEGYDFPFKGSDTCSLFQTSLAAEWHVLSAPTPNHKKLRKNGSLPDRKKKQKNKRDTTRMQSRISGEGSIHIRLLPADCFHAWLHGDGKYVGMKNLPH